MNAKEYLGKWMTTDIHGKQILWCEVIDVKGDTLTCYLPSNPVGYRVVKHDLSNIRKWVAEKSIFR